MAQVLLWVQIYERILKQTNNYPTFPSFLPKTFGQPPPLWTNRGSTLRFLSNNRGRARVKRRSFPLLSRRGQGWSDQASVLQVNGCCLLVNEPRFPSILFRTYSEVQPVSPTLIPLNEQLVIILLRLVGIFYQDIPVSLRLLDTRDPYIHSASSQMITRRRASNYLI